MDLRQLRYFKTIIEEGTITGAARKLHISQPPLSSQMHLLEKELGRETASKLLQNGDALFDDEELDVFTPHRPKKFLNFWM